MGTGRLAWAFALGGSIPENGTRAERTLHFTFAAALFSVLACFSLFLSTL